MHDRGRHCNTKYWTGSKKWPSIKCQRLRFQRAHTELKTFCCWLNNCQPDLTFTYTYSNTHIDYLDVTVKTAEGGLYTTLFRKPTERNTLLQCTSSHPRALRDGLPYGQFLRLRRNCKQKEDFFGEAETLSLKLANRGYPKRLIKRSMKTAWYSPRKALLESHKKEPTTRITCVTTFSPVSNKITKMIRKHWSVLAPVNISKEAPLFAVKKGCNIRDHLVRAYKPPPQKLLSLRHWQVFPSQGSV